jgi:4-hydroxybenzoate polyprenyltransferase
MASASSVIKSLFKISRSWNLAIIALAQYFTVGFLVNRSLLTDWHLFVLSLSTVTIAAGGYIINDYYDVKIDLINKPERVVVGRDIPRRYAILLHTVLSFSGVMMGFVLNWKIGAVNFMSAFLLWWYSNSLKRLPFVGNVAIAFLTGTSIAMVLLLHGGVLNYSDFSLSLIPGWHTIIIPATVTMVLIYALFAFFITLVREIIKDMEDLKGDNTFGCRTLPIVWGIRRTKNVIYILTLAFVMNVFIVDTIAEPLPMRYFAIFLFAPIAWLMIGVVRADTKKDFYRLSTLCKIIMVLGVISMALI